MGRASNRKWATRLTRWREARKVDELLKLRRLFGDHRKFRDRDVK